MELSTEILESLVMDNKDVIEVLKNGNVTENIIFESEVTEEDGEEGEIEEIIEIIEEVEEGDEAVSDDMLKDKLLKDNETVERIEKEDQSAKKELYGFSEENSMFTTQPITKESATSNITQKAIKQVINYDVDEDWQDEELERELENSELIDNQVGSLQTDKKYVNNQTISIPLQSNKVDLRIHTEFSGKSDKSRIENNIGNNVNIEDSDEMTHEIVKNVENNLLYTVLGTKKQDSLKQAQQDAHYVKMERLDENTIPVEGTIYYEGDNMETLYVAQAIDDNEQYQYDNATIEQDEQMSWDAANPESNQNQEEYNTQV